MSEVADVPLDLGRAILWTIAYSDVFDYPLTASEIARYLIGCRASPEAVSRALADDPLVTRHTATEDSYFFLTDRQKIVALRRRRAGVAAELWPRAVRYGRLIARLPFVRMVAVTGALAVDNPPGKSDLDYLIVTARGRLWTARAETIALVRAAAPLGDVICPNYFLSDDVLTLEDRNLFTAHEIAQMVPVSGFDTYERLRGVNGWTAAFLPNAAGMPREIVRCDPPVNWLQSMAEWAGWTRLGAHLERWEMTRKLRRFAAVSAGNPEAAFSAEVCKGHFEGHGRRILTGFNARLNGLGLAGFDPTWMPAVTSKERGSCGRIVKPPRPGQLRAR